MKRLLSVFWLFSVLFAFQASAQAPIQADLITQKEGVLPSGELIAALKLTMPAGWHVYWKNAGDAGEATELALTLPDGFSAGERLWTVPEKFSVGTLTEYGYHGQAYFPIKIKAPSVLNKGEILQIKAKAAWLACKDVCLPMQAEPTAFFTAGIEGDDNSELTAVLDGLAQPQPDAVFYETSAGLVLRLPMLEKARKAYFFPDSGKVLTHNAPQTLKIKDGNAFLFLTKALPEDYEHPEKLKGTVVFYDDFGDKTAAFKVSAESTNDSLPVFETFVLREFLSALFFALLGGLLLNLMPCVFPVLSLKAFSLLSAKTNGAQMKRESLLYTAGVLASFAVIGAVLVALRKAGAELGWGFQLQYPPFVLFLSLFMFFLGLLFSDMVTVGEGLAGFGMNFKHGLGHFGTGVLAVFVASPCAAPFMGVALGYGLMNPAPVTMAVLLAMGVGLAVPFLVLGFFPQTARFLPKPGAWLMLFRRFLAFPLFGAAAWLLWVLAAQEGSLALAWALTCLTLTAFATWLCGVAQSYPKFKLWAGLCVVLTVLSIGYALSAVAPKGESEAEKIEWIDYRTDTVESFRQQGIPVFLKFSAKWCLTCLVNDKTTFANADTVKAFKDKGVAAFFGDWTTRNDDITAAIESFGRGGIPLYVYYAPNAEKPVILPQIITPSEIVGLLR
ncbi:MAG TPA: hypothetical protein DD624_08850 [Alphaproteobacteria bacterium]|nr:hypothetical protein [Alphaproteobacteria bacterium]